MQQRFLFVSCMRFTREKNVFSFFFQRSTVVCFTAGICPGRFKVIYPKVYCFVDQCIGFAVIAECPQYTFPTETEDCYLDICFAQSFYRNCHVSIVPSAPKCCNARSSYEVSDRQREFSYNLIDICKRGSINRKLVYLQITPAMVKHFKVNRASGDNALILRDILNREGKKFGNYVIIGKDNTLILSWV